MATKAKRHTHKYHRIEISGDMVWSCALPACPHHMPKHMENKVIGKYSICWKCGAEFIMDPSTMKDDRPVCFNCNSSPIKDEFFEPPIPESTETRVEYAKRRLKELEASEKDEIEIIHPTESTDEIETIGELTESVTGVTGEK